jgi:hypothetical protein
LATRVERCFLAPPVGPLKSAGTVPFWLNG